MSLLEVSEAAKVVQEAAHPDANIIFGANIDDTLGDQVWVTVIATRFDGRGRRADGSASTGAPRRGDDDRGRQAPPGPSRGHRPELRVAAEGSVHRRARVRPRPLGTSPAACSAYASAAAGFGRARGGRFTRTPRDFVPSTDE